MNEDFLESGRLVKVQLEKHMAAEAERVLHDQELHKKCLQAPGSRYNLRPSKHDGCTSF